MAEGDFTVTAEVADFVINPFNLVGDLLNLTVFTQAHHKVGLLVLVCAVRAAQENNLVLQKTEKEIIKNMNISFIMLASFLM